MQNGSEPPSGSPGAVTSILLIEAYSSRNLADWLPTTSARIVRMVPPWQASTTRSPGGLRHMSSQAATTLSLNSSGLSQPISSKRRWLIFSQ